MEVGPFWLFVALLGTTSRVGIGIGLTSDIPERSVPFRGFFQMQV